MLASHGKWIEGMQPFPKAVPADDVSLSTQWFESGLLAYCNCVPPNAGLSACGNSMHKVNTKNQTIW